MLFSVLKAKPFSFNMHFTTVQTNKRITVSNPEKWMATETAEEIHFRFLNFYLKVYVFIK